MPSIEAASDLTATYNSHHDRVDSPKPSHTETSSATSNGVTTSVTRQTHLITTTAAKGIINFFTQVTKAKWTFTDGKSCVAPTPVTANQNLPARYRR
jgi:hypothetical protein